MQIDTLVVGALQENCYIITKNNFSIEICIYKFKIIIKLINLNSILI